MKNKNNNNKIEHILVSNINKKWYNYIIDINSCNIIILLKCYKLIVIISFYWTDVKLINNNVSYYK